ncbi:hypothetical protein QR685DRAFT_600537 [Neurospora intermedia]|uniref:Uncharacterized protein n=1 Tax=Neurospora intermedia TaxID=5142 RepID=A0ABR3D200_NEUIN
MSISRCRSACDVYRTLSLQPFPLCTFCEALTHISYYGPGTAQVNRLRRSSYFAPLPFLRAPRDNNLPTPSLNVSPPVQPTSQSTYTLVYRRLSFLKASLSDVRRRRRRATFPRRTSGLVISWPVRQHLLVLNSPSPLE